MADLLSTIDEWGETGTRREELRLLALLHDALKFQRQPRPPAHRGEPPRHARPPVRRGLPGRRAAAGHAGAARPAVRDLAQAAPHRAASTSERFDDMLERIPDIDAVRAVRGAGRLDRGQGPRAAGVVQETS